MVERRPGLDLLCHLLLWAGVAAVALPVWLALMASTHANADLASGTPLWFGELGGQIWRELLQGQLQVGNQRLPVGQLLGHSLLMALGITAGKLAISILSAFALVFFRFPGRQLAFWLIFLTLMLPVEVRIMPTLKVVTDLGLLNSFAGLTVPLMASATATFLFRQCFLSVPPELVEAARMDGAGPLRFFFTVLLPLSRTNLAALFVITFIYGWNQYLWPLLITTDPAHLTIVMSIKQLIAVNDNLIEWNKAMAITLVAMLPPVLVVLVMQKLFVAGLTETEK